jgi:membrane associated rhomboid family serine protease
MFPLSDENPTVHKPVATPIIIGVNVLTWAFLQGFGVAAPLAQSLCGYALIPADLLGNVDPGTAFRLTQELHCVVDGQSNWLTLVSSMFMHGGWFHIIGNMWFLWVFGDNVEDVMGPVRFTVFYLLCGFAAAFAQIVTDPDSIIPMVGASGAIGGVMGAYALLYPRAHVHTFIFLGFYMTTLAVPAVFMLGYWILLQVLGGLPAIAGNAPGGGVAFWAHIGGFLAGLVLVMVFVRRDYLQKHRSLAPRHRSRHRVL